MPDLKLHGGWRGTGPLCRVAASEFQAAHRQCGSGTGHPSHRSPLPDPHRTHPPPVSRKLNSNGSWISSASPNAGPRPYTACSGPIRISWFLHLAEAPRSTCRHRVLSISTWPPPSISTHSRMALYRCFCCSAEPFSIPTGDAPLQVAQIPWSKEAAFDLPVGVWKADDGRVLPQYRLAVPQPRRVRPASSVQDRSRTSDLGADRGEHAAVNLDMVERVANAVLYEGYMLYPYTASSVKNRQRWNFGVLSPPAYDACEMQTECLMRGRRQRQRQSPFPARHGSRNHRTRHRTVWHHAGLSARRPLSLRPYPGRSRGQIVCLAGHAVRTPA